jgi:methylated-DNA-[protein]-cysteine S-methyltransferase
MIVGTSAGRRTHAVVDSPIGPLTLVASDGKLAGLYMDVRGHEPAAAVLGEATTLGPDSDAVLTLAAGQLREYFAGSLTSFTVPVELAGTPFQRSVWAGLQAIGYGETLSYGELAMRVGAPGASRAVGLANGRNPVAIVVPCHRVVGADGSLTGYGGGLDRKRFLLELEQRVSGQTLA